MSPPTRTMVGGVGGGGGGATSGMQLQSPKLMTPSTGGASSMTASMGVSGVMPSGTVSGAASARGGAVVGVLARGAGGGGGVGIGMTWMNSVAVRGSGNWSAASSGAMKNAHTAIACTTIENAIV